MSTMRWQSRNRRGVLAQRGDDRRPDREVRDEVAVHDVDVEQVGLGGHAVDLVAEPGEVGGEDRRRQLAAHPPTLPPGPRRRTVPEGPLAALEGGSTNMPSVPASCGRRSAAARGPPRRARTARGRAKLGPSASRTASTTSTVSAAGERAHRVHEPSPDAQRRGRDDEQVALQRQQRRRSARRRRQRASGRRRSTPSPEQGGSTSARSIAGRRDREARARRRGPGARLARPRRRAALRHEREPAGVHVDGDDQSRRRRARRAPVALPPGAAATSSTRSPGRASTRAHDGLAGLVLGRGPALARRRGARAGRPTPPHGDRLGHDRARRSSRRAGGAELGVEPVGVGACAGSGAA